MVAAALTRLKGMVLLAVLTVALVATGFGHRLPSFQDAALEAYVSAGGVLADLCAEDGGKGGAAHVDCPVCHVVANLGPVPCRARISDADLILVATVVAPRESRALRHLPDPSRSSQSPPLA